MAKRRKAGESKSKKNGNPKEATVLIPLADNDETPFPPETIASIFNEIFVTFHGWTIEGTVKGAYPMQATGEKRVEELLKVSIILDESHVRVLEEMVGRWCKRLGQEVMLLKVADLVVKFIPPTPEAEAR